MTAALAWVMASRWRAAAVVAALAALGVPLTHLLGSAVLALVVLRRGALEGAAVAGIACAALVVLALVRGDTLAIAGSVVVALWVPVIVLASVLRRTSSQAYVLGLAGVLGCSIVAGMFMAAGGDPAAMWEEMLREVMIPAFEQVGLQFDREQLLARAATMTGWLGALWALVYYAAVIFGRWAQAKLYNPGGFAREFHTLRLGAVAVVIGGALFVAAMVTESPLAVNLSVVVVAVYAAQGFAMLHGLVAGLGAHWIWLVPAYVLGVLLPAVPAAMGFVDYWVDFRRRFAGGAE